MIINTVQDVMTRKVVTATPSTSWKDAVRLIEDARVHALPVSRTDVSSGSSPRAISC